ncbi:MAG: cation:proton antiporter regulatory subunit [Aquihabitans sp.]
MPDITETKLPGVGVRLEFTTESGDRLGVLVHRGGRREIMIYDEVDPDRCTSVLHLESNETQALSEMLGGSRISEVITGVEQEIEGLSIDWLNVPEGSPFVGKSIGAGMFRTKTGVSIVAVVRGSETFAAPGPDFVLSAGDVAVAVGTSPGIKDARTMLHP